jgi:F-type H+-transporting ATPase subunit delta
MLEQRIIKRYAEALFKSVRDEEKQQVLYENAAMIIDLCRENESLLLFLQNPVISRKKKHSSISTIFRDILIPEMMTFIRLVIEHKREVLLHAFLQEYVHLYKQSKNLLEAEVETAYSVDNKIYKGLQELLSHVSAYSSIELKKRINPELIGGFLFRYQDKLYDASVSKRLRQLKKHLTQ